MQFKANSNHWCMILIVFVLGTAPLSAATRTWVGGNGNWGGGLSGTVNWSPAVLPGVNDEAVFNTNHAVSLTLPNASVAAVTMSNGLSLDLNGNDLGVDGLLQLTGSGTDIRVPVNSVLVVDDITVNTGSDLILDRGQVILAKNGTANGLLDIRAGGEVRGIGAIDLNDSPPSVATILVNNGVLSAERTGGTDGILSVNATQGNTRIDLDGTGAANGVVEVNRNQTLDINVPLSDSFNGQMELNQNSRLDMRDPWELSGGEIVVNNGAIFLPPINVPSGVAYLAGGKLTQSGGAINVVDTDGRLQFDSEFDMLGGMLTNNGHVLFNADATIQTGANFVMNGPQAKLTVNSNVNVVVNQANFDADGSNAATNQITIEDKGVLDLNLGLLADTSLEGTIQVNGGTLDVATPSNSWNISRNTVLNLTGSPSSEARIQGGTLRVGTDSSAGEARINVGGTGTSVIPRVRFLSDAHVHIASGATLITDSSALFESVGVQQAQFTGNGTWILAGTNSFDEATTINMTGGTVDLDNASLDPVFNNLTFINAPLTIRAATLADYGAVLPFPEHPLNHWINIKNGMRLTLELDDPATEWTVNANIAYVGDATNNTFLAGNRVNLDGNLSVSGTGTSTAKLDIKGTIRLNGPSDKFVIAGVGDHPDVNFQRNTMQDGFIGGPGTLGAISGAALMGSGTIEARVDFDGTSQLFANAGKLTISGVIEDVGVIGTANVDAVLSISNPWNTNIAEGQVLMIGGIIEGATITNDFVAGIDGYGGEVKSQLINNSMVQAFANENGLPLVLSNATNDWDGATNQGRLVARENGRLELQDTADFQFQGTVWAWPGATVATQGFALQFQPNSTLRLEGGTYVSSAVTQIGGTVAIDSGTDSALRTNRTVEFLPTSHTTLDGNLLLGNQGTTIRQGATFVGSGQLVNLEIDKLKLDDGVNLPIILRNEGDLTFGTGGAQVNGRTYQQTASGDMTIGLGGTSLNDFDRLSLTGTASLSGGLHVFTFNNFSPTLGDTFTVISALGGVTGVFDSVSLPTLNPGLLLKVLYQPTNVTLQVTQGFATDLNGDGAVDAGDAGILFGNWGNAGAGDFNNDGIVDAADAGQMFSEWTGDATTPRSVPEPSGGLFWIGLAWCHYARRKFGA